MTRLAQEWVDRAEDDLGIACREYRGRGSSMGVMFHSQQSAEKMLKALMLERGIAVPHTHELRQLLARLSDPALGAALSYRANDWQFLESGAVVASYPGSVSSRSDALRALRMSLHVRRRVRQALGAWPP